MSAGPGQYNPHDRYDKQKCIDLGYCLPVYDGWIKPEFDCCPPSKSEVAEAVDRVALYTLCDDSVPTSLSKEEQLKCFEHDSNEYDNIGPGNFHLSILCASCGASFGWHNGFSCRSPHSTKFKPKLKP